MGPQSPRSPVRFRDILQTVKGYAPAADLDTVRKAYVFAAMAHKKELRRAGGRSLGHVLSVAKTLADMRMDVPTVCCGLLHAAVEDAEVDGARLEGLFGAEIRALLDGLAKIGKMAFPLQRERNVESYRKLVIAMSKDVRILLIKLADRLDTIRNIESVPAEQRTSLAQETLSLYAPVANRLGMYWMRAELEDRSFELLEPGAYKEIRDRVAVRVQETAEAIDQVSAALKEAAKQAGIECRISGRVKHYYSVYRKMLRQGIDIDQVFDLLAVRVIVAHVRQCYELLGIIHSLWVPVPGRIKDYIAKPKANRYRSLHTTVISSVGECVEIQIRTEEMHREAEQGIAAHWMYKEGVGFSKKDERHTRWARQLVEALQETPDGSKAPGASAAVDLFPEQIYVFTPKGEVKELPKGATPIDFAYRIHTEVGHHCAGAKVNGRLVTLRHELANGDVVEIITSKQQSPRKHWLDIVKTGEAKTKIRSWLRREEKIHSQSLGKEILEKGLKKYGLTYARLVQDGVLKGALKALQTDSIEELLRAVAYGKISVRQIYDALPARKEEAKEEGHLERDIEKIARKAERASDTGISVKGVHDVLVRLAKCCNPLLGEEIVGFITRGRGVTIHAASCPVARLCEPERLVDVRWDAAASPRQRTRIKVVSVDRPGLLAAISKVISSANVDISNAEARTTEDKQAVAYFEIMVRDLFHLKDLMASIEQVRGVIHVERVQR